MELRAFGIHMGPAACAVDLGDGSERGEYVNQDYILQKLGRPHRSINLMYCYYPLDKGWPQRARDTVAKEGITFQWDFPYDDYFPYKGGLGSGEDVHLSDLEPFKSMRDIRSHGQDVTLTLTIDCAVSDGHLRAIAKELRPFGRMQLRINHEATGNWFAFNKRYSYQEVADFFVRFHTIIKEEAPHIQTILCIGGGPEGDGKMACEKEFQKAIQACDIWSGDYYLALNWGWPYTIAETNGNTHKRYDLEEVLNNNRFSYERFLALNNGEPKPLVISEFNADGDVTGPFEQASMMQAFYNRIRDEKAAWLKGITMYQFRDRGRLGLETEDPNHPEVGIEQPLLSAYREIIHDPYFMPRLTLGEALGLPIRLRWGGAEDAEGIAIPIEFEGNPVFFEIQFEDDSLNAIMEINGHWFYKKPGVNRIDGMSAFCRKPLSGPSKLYFKLFLPPAEGVNDPSQGPDWTINYYSELHKLPTFRIRYQPTETGPYAP